jgi:hypothetical protein
MPWHSMIEQENVVRRTHATEPAEQALAAHRAADAMRMNSIHALAWMLVRGARQGAWRDGAAHLEDGCTDIGQRDELQVILYCIQKLTTQHIECESCRVCGSRNRRRCSSHALSQTMRIALADKSHMISQRHDTEVANSSSASLSKRKRNWRFEIDGLVGKWRGDIQAFNA